MKPAAGVTATRPTTIAVAAPTAVGLRDFAALPPYARQLVEHMRAAD